MTEASNVRDHLKDGKAILVGITVVLATAFVAIVFSIFSTAVAMNFSCPAHARFSFTYCV